jgi:TolB-like protein
MPDDHSTSGVSAAQVRTQCDRILASKGFLRSGRQSAFLEYVVNATLEGHADRLKEFSLGIEVFDKDESFDPGVDSIVRVEASRLRSKLSEYYVGEGQGDAVRIGIPKGHYVPEFQLADVPKVERSLAPSWQLLAGFVVATSIFALIFFNYWMPRQAPNPAASSQQLPPSSSIAVLPLRDWSRTPEEYFSEAMTDALISSLAEIGSLRVTSLTSVMRYQNTETPIPEIGRVLGVAYILEGSVTRDGERVRIIAQLIQAESDEHVWSKTFDRTASDLLSVQSEVAVAIAALVSDEIIPASQTQPEGLNPVAYEAFLKGRYFYNQFTGDGFRRSISFFQKAIEIEPDYAAAYAGLASCHCLLAGHGLELVSPVVAIPEARSMANKALSLNSDLVEPIAFLGIISFKYEWDPEKAEKMLNRAIELNPSLFHAHVWQSQILEALSRNEEALGHARFAKQLNPLSLAANLNLGWQMFQAEKYIEANAEVDNLIEFNPNFWGGHWAKGHIYNQHESYRNAIDEFLKAVELGGGHSLPMSGLGYTYALAGMRDEARQVIADMEALSKDVYVSPFHIAIVYAGLNEPDLMFEWLERAFQVRSRSLAWLQVFREMKPFHGDPRFQNLLARIGVYSNSVAG